MPQDVKTLHCCLRYLDYCWNFPQVNDRGIHTSVIRNGAVRKRLGLNGARAFLIFLGQQQSSDPTLYELFPKVTTPVKPNGGYIENALTCKDAQHHHIDKQFPRKPESGEVNFKSTYESLANAGDLSCGFVLF